MIYDFNTKNKSFLALYEHLKKKGVKNNNFFLMLFDKGLIGIDPRDPELTDEYKYRILIECKNNYWYFLREVVLLPSIDSNCGVNYNLNRGTLAFNYCLVNNFNAMIDLPNYYGKEISIIIRTLWEYLFIDGHYKTILINNRTEYSVNNLKKMKDIYGLLPSYLRIEDICYDKTIYIRSNYKCIEVAKQAKTKATAELIGREMTQNRQIFYNFEKIKNNEILFNSSRLPFHQIANQSKKDNKPYGTILITTGGVLGEPSGDFAYKVKQLSLHFEELYYDLDIESIRDKLDNNWYPFLYVTFNILELNRTDDWITNRLKEMCYDWNNFIRDQFVFWC